MEVRSLWLIDKPLVTMILDMYDKQIIVRVKISSTYAIEMSRNDRKSTYIYVAHKNSI